MVAREILGDDPPLETNGFGFLRNSAGIDDRVLIIAARMCLAKAWEMKTSVPMLDHSTSIKVRVWWQERFERNWMDPQNMKLSNSLSAF